MMQRKRQNEWTRLASERRVRERARSGGGEFEVATVPVRKFEIVARDSRSNDK